MNKINESNMNKTVHQVNREYYLRNRARSAKIRFTDEVYEALLARAKSKKMTFAYYVSRVLTNMVMFEDYPDAI